MSAIVCKQKLRLVEKLGVFLEKKEQLAPVEARILSYIILTGKVGTTFEDLVTHLCASKSTISTHLSHLQDLKKVIYFTKSGDRKKYFTINQDHIIHSIDNMMESWLSQKDLHIEIRDYKENANSTSKDEASKFDLDFHDNYIKFLNEATKSISELRTKIIENNNKL
tara:strand:- start:54797 stop:55297 length:501 start_codon:yes stop_codon:yes gene_type:complete